MAISKKYIDERKAEEQEAYKEIILDLEEGKRKILPHDTRERAFDRGLNAVYNVIRKGHLPVDIMRGIEEYLKRKP